MECSKGSWGIQLPGLHRRDHHCFLDVELYIIYLVPRLGSTYIIHPACGMYDVDFHLVPSHEFHWPIHCPYNRPAYAYATACDRCP